MPSDAIVSAEHLFTLPASPGLAALDDLKYRIFDRLTQQLDLAKVRDLPDAHRRTELRLLAQRFLAVEEPRLDAEVREQLLDEILDELIGLGQVGKLMHELGGG